MGASLAPLKRCACDFTACLLFLSAGDAAANNDVKTGAFLKWECVPDDVSVDDTKVIAHPALASCLQAMLEARDARPSEPKWAPLEFKQKQVKEKARRVIKWKPPSNGESKDAEAKTDGLDADITELTNTDIAIRAGQRLLRPAIPRRLDEDVVLANIKKLAEAFPTHFRGALSLEATIMQWEQWRNSHPRRIGDVPAAALPTWWWPTQATLPSLRLPPTIDELAHNYRGSIAYINLVSGNRSASQTAARIQAENDSRLPIAKSEIVFVINEGVKDADASLDDKNDSLPLWMAEALSDTPADAREGIIPSHNPSPSNPSPCTRSPHS